MAPRTPSTTVAGHIAVIDGQPTTTTQDIAEVYGKRHDDVLRIVRQRMADVPAEWRLRNFAEASIERPQTNGGTVSYPVIRMTKKGFHFVVGKFTGAKAVAHQIAFADEFERMENELSARTAPISTAAPELTHTGRNAIDAMCLASSLALMVQQSTFKALIQRESLGTEQLPAHLKSLVYQASGRICGEAFGHIHAWLVADLCRQSSGWLSNATTNEVDQYLQRHTFAHWLSDGKYAMAQSLSHLFSTARDAAEESRALLQRQLNSLDTQAPRRTA